VWIELTKDGVAAATSLERSQRNCTSIIYDCNAANRENWAKIGRVHFEKIGLEGTVKTGSTFGS